MTSTPKTLLVNCSLKGIVSKDLFNTVKKFSESKVEDFSALGKGYFIGRDIDAIVISGSAARIVDPQGRTKFKKLADLIRTCDLPILGICFGHQLLAWAMGAKVGSLPQRVFDQFENIRILERNGIFTGYEGTQTLRLAENHYDYVLKDGLESAGFKLLADSASCEVEAVKHASKPLWGVQFHPERITVKGETNPDGHRVIENFYRNVVR